MPATPDILPLFLHVPRKEIAYVKFLFESYEGIAVVRTLDPDRALLVVLVAPDFEATARAVVAELVAEGTAEETGPPPGDGDWLGPEDEESTS